MSGRDTLHQLLNDGREQGARRAALLLHSATTADRAWLLDGVSAEHRPTLELMLAELATLGVPTDRGLLVKVLSEREGRQEGGARAHANPDAFQLESAAEAVRLLQGEPAWLVACALSLGPQPWRQAVIAQMDPVCRPVRVEPSGEACPCPPKLAAALRNELAARTQEVPPQQPPGNGAWRAMWTRLRGARA